MSDTKKDSKEQIAQITSVLQKVAMGNFSQTVEIPKQKDEFTKPLIALNLTIDNLRKARKSQEIKQQEVKKQIEERTQELQTILDSIPAWIFYKDKKNRFVKVNEAFCKAMQKNKEELEGKSLFDLYPKNEAEAYWKDDKETMAFGEPIRNIIEPVKTPEGRIWVQTDKIPYKDEKNHIIGILGFAVDITERKLAEEKLKKQVEETEKINKLMFGRELEMKELKKRIEELERKTTN